MFNNYQCSPSLRFFKCAKDTKNEIQFAFGTVYEKVDTTVIARTNGRRLNDTEILVSCPTGRRPQIKTFVFARLLFLPKANEV